MVLLTQDATVGASMDDLRETYKALTGQELECEDPGPARNKVVMALLTSADIVGHLGVPRDTTPKPMTIQQLRQMGEKMDKQDAVEQEVIRFAPGSLADQLQKTADAMPKIEPRQPRKEPSAPRTKITRVISTGEGTSKPQEGSLRSAVLKHIQANAEQGNDTELDAMEAALGYPVRGHVQKLLEKNHLKVTGTTAPEAKAEASTEAAA